MCKKIYILQLIVLIGFATRSASAQLSDLHFQNYTAKNGLSNNTVTSIAQDTMGFIWIGTEDGLNRFDGTGFTVYRNNPSDPYSIPANSITCMLADHTGKLWIGTSGGGICFYDHKSNRFISYRPDFKLENYCDFNITNIFEDSNGNIWISHNDRLTGVSLYNRNADNFSFFCPGTTVKDFSEPANRIVPVAEDGNGMLWMGSQKGLWKFDPAKKKFIKLCKLTQPGWNEEQSNIITALLNDPNGYLWVGTWGTGLFSFDPGNENSRMFLPNPNRKNDGRYNIIKDIQYLSENELWVCGPVSGLGVFNKKTGSFSFFQKDASLPGTIASEYGAVTMLKDRENILWIGFEEFGLVKYDPRVQIFHTVNLYPQLNMKGKRGPETFRIPDVTSVKKHPVTHQYILATTYGKGLLIADSTGSNIRYIIPPQLNSQQIRDDISINFYQVYMDKNGIIWVVGDWGIFKLDLIHQRLVPFKLIDTKGQYLPRFPIVQILPDANDNLWLGTYEQGFLFLNKLTGKVTQWIHYPVIQGTKISQTGAVVPQCIDKKGCIWIKMNHAVTKFDPGNNVFTDYVFDPVNPAGITSPHIQSIVEDNQGFIWIAHWKHGLEKLDPLTGRIKKYTATNGLASNQTNGMVKDKKGILWITTSSGLSKFDPAKDLFTTYTSFDGLLYDNQLNTIRLQENGNICLGFPGGFQWFDPSVIFLNTLPPKVMFTGCKILGKDTIPDMNKGLSLEHYQNSLEFKFAAISFSNSEKNKFAYKMEGLDKDWNYLSGKNIVSYSGIPPGKYKLMIRASNGDGVWSDEKILKVVIFPPYWETVWFRSLMAILLAAVICMIVYFRVRKVRTEETRKAEFNRQLADVEMKALRAQINPHFIFNCLNSINKLIIEKDNKTASVYLTKFSKLVRLILENSEKKFIPLQDEITVLKLYLEMESQRFKNRFSYDVIVAPDIDSAKVEVPALIFQPYCENAIWHGLLHKKEPGRLTLHLYLKDGFLFCTIEDNGIGRKASEEIKDHSMMKSKSMGMKTSADRLLMLSTFFGSEAAVNIIDLYDPKDQPCGTRVELKLPVE